MLVILTIPDTFGRAMHSEITRLLCHAALGSKAGAKHYHASSGLFPNVRNPPHDPLCNSSKFLGFSRVLCGMSLAMAGPEEMKNLMRKTLSLGLLAVLTLSGRPLAAPAGIDAALGSNVSVTSATLSISGTSTMHPYTVSTKALKVGAAHRDRRGSARDCCSPERSRASSCRFPSTRSRRTKTG